MPRRARVACPRSYWFGHDRKLIEGVGADAYHHPRPDTWNRLLPPDETARAIGQTGNGEAPEGHGAGRLIAIRSDALSRADLRTLMTPEEVAEAERVADRFWHVPSAIASAAGAYQYGVAR